MLAQFASVCVIHPKALKSRVSKAMGGTSPGRSLLRSPSMLLWLGCRTRPPSSDVGGHRLACMALKLTGLHPPVACELQSPAASLRPWWPVPAMRCAHSAQLMTTDHPPPRPSCMPDCWHMNTRWAAAGGVCVGDRSFVKFYDGFARYPSFMRTTKILCMNPCQNGTLQCAEQFNLSCNRHHRLLSNISHQEEGLSHTLTCIQCRHFLTGLERQGFNRLQNRTEKL